MVGNSATVKLEGSMPQALFDQVVDGVKALTPEERQKLRVLLESWPDEPERVWTEEEFAEEMERKGLITRPKGPRPDPATYREPTLIQIEGEPLSEQIIRERR
jgi:hypothetical protein